MKEKILIEITEFCRDCESCQNYPEEDCVLFRIERIIEGEEHERRTTERDNT